MQITFKELPRSGVVRFSEFSKFVGFASYTTLRKKIKDNSFPKPTIVTGHVRYWAARDIWEYCDGRTNWQ